MGVNVLTWNIETQTYDLPDWHRRQLNKKLVEEYPFLLPRMLSTDTISDDYDYQYTLFDDIPSGWREEFGIEMCEEIKKVLEKYGKENIISSDTYFIKKRPFKFFKI